MLYCYVRGIQKRNKIKIKEEENSTKFSTSLDPTKSIDFQEMDFFSAHTTRYNSWAFSVKYFNRDMIVILCLKPTR